LHLTVFPQLEPAGASAQKVTVLNLGDDSQLNDFCPSAAFSLIFEGLSISARKTDVFFAEAKRDFLTIKTCQKTHLKIKVPKTVGALFLDTVACLVPIFKGFTCRTLCFHHKGQARNRTFLFE
jgi:hypothetical protein